ncbi:MAG: EamA family transporter [Rhodobacteraceae bacterium]|nr:EamA family transporter [Paracoccaceae bacterium]
MSSVAYYALVPTVFGFTLWYKGAASTRTSDAALMTAVMPVAALALTALVLGETVSVRQSMGCAKVIIAIILGFGKSE